MKRSLLLAILYISSIDLYPQAYRLDTTGLEAVQVTLSTERVMNKQAVMVIKEPSVTGFDEPTFAKVKGVRFRNGTIEVTVLSRLLPTASAFARGFIGIAFRINDSSSRFESIYIRPTNGRADDQLRRNHAIQYFAYPDYKFERLRREAPGVYESYADMGLNEWIKLKIVVKDSTAKLFINNTKQPSLIVNDLKNGGGAPGAVGLWVDTGTAGYFRDLKILPEK